jgi:hypothetical protein
MLRVRRACGTGHSASPAIGTGCRSGSGHRIATFAGVVAWLVAEFDTPILFWDGTGIRDRFVGFVERVRDALKQIEAA